MNSPVASLNPWSAWIEGKGDLGRAPSLLAATRLCGFLNPTDDLKRRVTNHDTGETLEWTRPTGWLTTQRARSDTVRKPYTPPPFRADLDG